MKDDFYSLTILNPVVADMGKYTLVVKDGKETYHTGAYLDVKGNISIQMYIHNIMLVKITNRVNMKIYLLIIFFQTRIQNIFSRKN